jgi:hypothetical protein
LKTLEGWISEYWEQGMERMPLRIFQDREFCKSRLEGWKFEGMYLLQPNQSLTIYDDNNCTLWDGQIKVLRFGFLKLNKMSPDSYYWTPEDVEFETWRDWFKESPPLKAKLTLPLEASGKKN